MSLAADGTTVRPTPLNTRQNGDGGWGYNTGRSWTEPTALAVLALHSGGLSAGPEVARGMAWLRARQRADGGWPPNDAVDASTSVTAVALLALGSQRSPNQVYSAGVRWLLARSRPELGTADRCLHWLQHTSDAKAENTGGCPWFPGTAAWVAPTVMMILAFDQAMALGYKDPQLPTEADRARRYLFSRRCEDGGWNHGGTAYRGPNGPSYPEMTGLALLAFHPDESFNIRQSIACATSMAIHPPSAEAQALLHMGLMRHGLIAPETKTLACRTTRDVALAILSQAGPTNPLFVRQGDIFSSGHWRSLLTGAGSPCRDPIRSRS